jgi:hypothetical protein
MQIRKNKGDERRRKTGRRNERIRGKIKEKRKNHKE